MHQDLSSTERIALDILKAKGEAAVLDIAAAAIAPPGSTGNVIVPRAVYRSFAKALRSLANAGLVVDLGRNWQCGARHYALPEVAESCRS